MHDLHACESFEFRAAPRSSLVGHAHQRRHLCLVMEGELTECTSAGEREYTAGQIRWGTPSTPVEVRFGAGGSRCRMVVVGPRHPAAEHPAWRSVAGGSGPQGSVSWETLLRVTEARDEFDLEQALFLLLADTAAREPSPAPPWLTEALASLPATLESKPGLRVHQLARQAGVHPVHLARACRRATGRSPRAHLRALRLERARQLIGASKLPLAEIALATGFSDQSHLGRLFLGRYGVSPARHRARLQSF